MNFNHRSGRELVARSAVVARLWKDACFGLLAKERKSSLTSTEFTRSLWNRMSSTYYLETLNFSDGTALLRALIDKLHSITGISSKNKIRNILEGYGPGIVFNEHDVEKETKAVIASETTNQELLLSIVKDSFDISHEIIPKDYVVVNNLVNVFDTLRAPDLKDKSKVYSAVLPHSKKYNRWLIDLLNVAKVKYVLFTTLPQSQFKEKTLKAYSLTLVTNTQVDQQQIMSEISIPEFPYRSKFMPPFEQMFKALIESNQNRKIEWSQPVEGCNLGVVSKRYPSDYETVTSLADHYVEKARVKCMEGQYTSGGETFVPVSPIDAWTSLMLSPRRPEILKMSIHDQRDEVWKISKGCSLFNTSLAAYIYTRFGARNGRVLDYSSGWGDRLIGAHVAGVKEYVHFDPNPDLGEVYAKVDAECSRITGRKIRRTYSATPFEDNLALFDKEGKYHERFIMAFTSPPFYDKELYTGSETSTARYTTYREWLDKFHKPSVSAAWQSLVSGGWLCLYLPHSDRDADMVNEMYRTARDAVNELRPKASKFEFCLGYMQLKDGVGAARKTFMWRKM